MWFAGGEAWFVGRSAAEKEEDGFVCWVKGSHVTAFYSWVPGMPLANISCVLKATRLLGCEAS
jgi:hypothetical protein